MKKQLLSLTLLIAAGTCVAQTSPPAPNFHPISSNSIATVSDTIDFTGMSSYTTVNNFYLYTGAMFMGYNSSSDPQTYDYGTSSYGSILHSDNWYNPLRLNFVDPNNSSVYVPIQKVEFDNPIAVTETDYMSIDIYNTSNVLIYHYLSTSPEHVVINLGQNIGAYMTVDDSAGTAYVIDNIVFNNDAPTGVTNITRNTNVNVFPNPCKGQVTIQTDLNTANSTLFVYDPLGKEVALSFSKEEKGFKVDCSVLSSGIYIFKVIDVNGQLRTGRFSVN